MFSKANAGKVWTPVEFHTVNEDGAEVTQRALFLFSPLPRKDYQQRRRDSVTGAAAAIRNATAPALDPAVEGQATPDGIADETIKRLLDGIERNFQATEADAALLRTHTHDWRALKDENQEDVPFDPDHFANLLEFDVFFIPVAEAFDALCRGAIRKNSSPGPAGVPARGQA